MTTKVLNLYAGIGGNRRLWQDVDVTAVEWDREIAEVYQDNFPDDNVIVADAHEFLLDHYDDGWDFIWSSPPCPSHSRTNIMMVIGNDGNARYPDMRLYQEIILLRHFHDLECDWVVENVMSYYEPLVKPTKVHRHYFWSNYYISDFTLDESASDRIGGYDKGNIDFWQNRYGFDLSEYDLGSKKEKMLKNCVHPKVGRHVFECSGIKTNSPTEW